MEPELIGGDGVSDMMSGGGESNKILSTSMCSPLMIVGLFVLLEGCSLYKIREVLGRYNHHKMQTLAGSYTVASIMLTIMYTVVMYSICAYNKENIVWWGLLLPVVYMMVKTYLILQPISIAYNNAPEVSTAFNGFPSNHYGISPELQKALLEQSVKQGGENQFNQSINKNLDLNMIKQGGGGNGGNGGNMNPPLGLSSINGGGAPF